jgi:hypothetical protein
MGSPAVQKNTPFRATLSAARQALLAPPTRGRVASSMWHDLATNTAFTLPLVGRVAKLGPKGRSAARKGVTFG